MHVEIEWSVFHTDLPMIISGEKLAYLDPLEMIWPKELGQSYNIQDIYSQSKLDSLAAFEVDGFSAETGMYPGTLFRFPLRTKPSDLSEISYTVREMHDLLTGLREEAKFLLLFLHSVQKIEVYEIPKHGPYTLQLFFQVAICEKDSDDIDRKRKCFMDELKTESAQASPLKYCIARSIGLVIDFWVEVHFHDTITASHWLVVSQVGSQCEIVRDAAAKQHVFPWVGVAVELSSSHPTSGGRIFCFLPLPIEASSSLPVHVNGTFGLSDDRRILKWPTIERQNDLAAKWNKMLVSKLLPSCYAQLLLEAKNHLRSQLFYEVWPEVDAVMTTHWEGLLLPLFTQLLIEAVVWTEHVSQPGEWIGVSEGTFVPNGSKDISVICNVLYQCGFKLVDIPPRIWNALDCSKTPVSEVSPSFVRTQLRRNLQSYYYIDEVEKLDLLRYCLSDEQYSELHGLALLPLADHNFTSFEVAHQGSESSCYLCSVDCPRYLLPNLDRILVDLPCDSDLLKSLNQVADSQATQLSKLTTEKVAELLPESMPAEWEGMQIVTLPHYRFPSDWFQKFWEWVQNKSLHSFAGKLIIPISQSSQKYGMSFCVTQLNMNSAVVYVPLFARFSLSLLAALDKLQVMLSKVLEFPYLQHFQLSSYLKQFDPTGILDAIRLSNFTSYLQGVKLTSEEAFSVRQFLSSGLDSVIRQKQPTIQSLPIFVTAQTSSGNLYSVEAAIHSSPHCMAVVEPENSVVSAVHLPSNLCIFSHRDYYQLKLLRCLNRVLFPSNVDFLLDHLIPLIQRRVFPGNLLDGLMQEILDSFQILVTRCSSMKQQQLVSALRSLPFLRTQPGIRKSPRQLFDPSVHLLCELFNGEFVFPTSPFNKPRYLQLLRSCGLRTSIEPQDIVDIICAISSSAAKYPQPVDSTKLCRSKAVLKYLSECDVAQLKSINVTTSNQWGSYTCPFSTALKDLATYQNWLPVCPLPPEDYPLCLEWKGGGFPSHFISLSGCSVLIPTHDNFNYLPLVFGSQLYLLDYILPSNVAQIFTTRISVGHILAHFQKVIHRMECISADMITRTVHLIYQHLDSLNKLDPHQLHGLHSFPEWIWIKRHKKFISPTIVAMNHNSSFRHNLEPYIYILPDELTKYSDLFSIFGMKQSVTQSQIVSVLSMIRGREPCSVCDASDAREAWQTVISILNWLTSDGTQKPSLSEEDTLYVPVESECQWPQLMEVSSVVYTDNNFLQDFLASTSDSELYNFVNCRIHSKMAHNLGLTLLSDHLKISEDTFEDAGQHEPLTVRLKNILKDYKDGLTIVKELLQNADDAEATEINICYDTRQHNVNPKLLFFPGMKDCHGPALVVHNNSTFSQDDFVNITRLATATKANKPQKIGKFGVGFCSVYHITDVPSFVSQETLCIFDPTLSYLKKEIKNPGKPGKKTTFTSRFIASSSQLVPYAGLFGFDPKKPYSGTIFRFPFRTSASELSGTLYTEATIRELINDIKNCSSKLFLFLQHIESITFSQIDQGDLTPRDLLQITKEAGESISGALAEVKKLTCQDFRVSQTCEDHWLIATHTGCINKKHATASVACLLEVTTPSKCYVAKKTEGEIFCFLSLAQKTGLPVHVSSNFAVINNRRGIWTADETSENDSEVQWNVFLMQNDSEVQWNISLMQTVIPKAYQSLLVSLQKMHYQGKLEEYIFYSLWPLKTDLTQHNPWIHAVHTVYGETISSCKLSSCKLFHSVSTGQWLTLQESQFLERGILCQSSLDADTPNCILDAVTHLRLPLVKLPSEYHIHLSLGSSTITEENFIQLFFQNVASFSVIQQSRNEVLQCMLEEYAVGLGGIQTIRMKYMEKYLTKHPCVPCTPYGSQLKKCSEIIDRRAEFSNLFDSAEGMFPTQQFRDRHLVVVAMVKLGMISKDIPWNLVIDRAETIVHIYHTDRTKALDRVRLVLQCIESKANHKQPNQEAKPLSAVQFLPVLKKPVNYPLSWHGEGHQLLSGKELTKIATTYHYCQDNNINIAGSQVTFVNEMSVEEGGCEYINEQTREILQIKSSPSCQDVVYQLKQLITEFNSQRSNPELVNWADLICKQAYEFLDGEMPPEILGKQTLGPVMQKLQDLPCVWTGKEFIEIQKVAKEWKLEGPYLYSIPSSLSSRKHLTAFLGIKDRFTPEDIAGALSQMTQDFNSNPVDKACQKLLHELVPDLYSIKPSEYLSPIMLPDTSFVMHMSSELAFNDAPWCKPEEHYKFVNGIIARDLALQLKVKTVRSKKLEKYVSDHIRGIPFGPHEELTQRIQSILREYPFDITLLKELLQNADDAKATKMYVILDKRTHGQESVLSENWQQLQGPALLVWNDSTFTEKDLEGIQQLGLGSKRLDEESIGQFGIGLNVVYHLTDCPSFITGGKTLCIMDPHCWYVPEATSEIPGRRYDELKSGFWDDFPDLKSAYLQDGVKDCPPELLDGTLFRFPLRQKDQLMKSQIVDHSVSYKHGPLTIDRIHGYLSDWAPKMKHALLFLNHVTEMSFFVIESCGESVLLSTSPISPLVSEYSIKVCIDATAQQRRRDLHEKDAAFKMMGGSKPFVVTYPLTVTETLPPQVYPPLQKREQKNSMVWIIQQGIGDLDNEQQTWNYISHIKPKHGIAAPLSSVEHLKEFHGNVFCFLPLPVSCNLPVHVNAQFILNTSRRNIWQPTVPGEVEIDDKSRWNENLLKAISSSYAIFLKRARSYYIKSVPYEDLKALNTAIQCYYSVFPNWSEELEQDQPVVEGPWRKLAKDIYRKLAGHNACVLATIEPVCSPTSTAASTQEAETSGPDAQYTVKWQPLDNSDCPRSQVYFWKRRPSHDNTALKRVLGRIGMKITCAPLKIMDHFKSVGCEIPAASPSSVYDYYTRQANPHDKISCPVEESAFQSLEAFKSFTKYLLKPVEASFTKEFPKPPFGYLLLLTADGQIRNFDERNKVLSSKYSHLFSESLEKFLHPELLDVKYSTSYFLDPSIDSDRYVLDATVHNILSNALPLALRTTHVLAASTHIDKPTLICLWACLSDDQDLFYSHLESVLECWALLPSTSNQLFSSRSKILPVIPPSNDPPKLMPGDPDISAVYQLLNHMGVPYLATEVVCAGVVIDYCPQLCDHECMLTILYHIHQNRNISSMITEYSAFTLISYLRYINFQVCQDECRRNIRALPLFLTVEGRLTSLDEKTVYIWPMDACSIGYAKWMSGRDVIFLDSGGEWIRLGRESDMGVQEICTETLYINYIFPVFSQLSEDERFEHLKHIRDHLFEKNMFRLKYLSEKQLAESFLSELMNLHCLGRDGDPLICASGLCNHTEEIFTTFDEHFCFLPEVFRGNKDESEKWLNFFSAIGLRNSITKQEYQNLCSETADGRHLDLRKASSALLRYLFSTQAKDDKWNTDLKFLSSISQIPFVCTKRLPELSWIQPVCFTENYIRSKGISMTKLADAALDKHSSILWTVKPIVHLPCNEFVCNWHTKLLTDLAVTKQPIAADVNANLHTIAKSRFAKPKFKVFDTFPQDCRPPEKATGLEVVMLKHFEFLNETSTDLELKSLSSVSCIPVFATPNQLSVDQRVPVVLVKPSCVLADKYGQGYYPFLHCIPNELLAVLHVLHKIGVKSSFELTHVRIVLKGVLECSDQLQNKFNTAEKVVNVIERLYIMLEQIRKTKSMEKRDIVSALQPLYLPSSQNNLVCTSELVYCDSMTYKSHDLDRCLSKAGLFLLHLPTAQFSECEFCEYLPNGVRPKELSTCCLQTLCEECTCVANSHFAEKLKTTFNLALFPKAVLVAIKHSTSDEKLCKEFLPFLLQFLQNIQVLTVNDLQTDVVLMPDQNLGRARVDVYLQKARTSMKFYVNSKLSDVKCSYTLEYLAEYFIAAVKSMSADVSCLRLRGILTMLLRAQTAEDIIDVLHKERLPTLNYSIDAKLPQPGPDGEADESAQPDPDGEVDENPRLGLDAEVDENPQPDPEEGERWMKQAKTDFKALTVLQDHVQTYPELAGSVCFMAHEVAEKALKGGMYAKFGLKEGSLANHQLIPLASDLQACTDPKLVECTDQLSGYYLNTRFPNRYPRGTKTPSEYYSPQLAQQAKKNAETILEKMNSLVNN